MHGLPYFFHIPGGDQHKGKDTEVRNQLEGIVTEMGIPKRQRCKCSKDGLSLEGGGILPQGEEGKGVEAELKRMSTLLKTCWLPAPMIEEVYQS